jgi:hypothetical protein
VTTTMLSDTRQHLTPESTPPLPLAIGVLSLPNATTQEDRRLARLSLALDAYKLGYFIIDILDITPGTDTSGYAWAKTLAQRTDADAFVCAGNICSEQLMPIANEIRMVIRDTTEPAHTVK